MQVSATPLMVIQNIIRVAKRGPLTHLIPPTFDDITTDDHLYDLIMSIMSNDDQKMRHFGLMMIRKCATWIAVRLDEP